ncbi:MAG: DHCW motif cupin fold protein [Hymenobacteraceae bacterium]|nr:DHCW motif cupin fold protein [Hymenobacteraceae bacterium]
MEINNLPFGTITWADVEAEAYAGTTGHAWWRTRHFSPTRVRIVEYSPAYLADHWCQKGHVLLVLAGELETELADGRTFLPTAGMSYQVANGAEPHRSRTATGARLFIVD